MELEGHESLPHQKGIYELRSSSQTSTSTPFRPPPPLPQPPALLPPQPSFPTTSLLNPQHSINYPTSARRPTPPSHLYLPLPLPQLVSSPHSNNPHPRLPHHLPLPSAQNSPPQPDVPLALLSHPPLSYPHRPSYPHHPLLPHTSSISPSHSQDVPPASHTLPSTSQLSPSFPTFLNPHPLLTPTSSSTSPHYQRPHSTCLPTPSFCLPLPPPCYPTPSPNPHTPPSISLRRPDVHPPPFPTTSPPPPQLVPLCPILTPHRPPTHPTLLLHLRSIKSLAQPDPDVNLHLLRHPLSSYPPPLLPTTLLLTPTLPQISPPPQPERPPLLPHHLPPPRQLVFSPHTSYPTPSSTPTHLLSHLASLPDVHPSFPPLPLPPPSISPLFPPPPTPHPHLPNTLLLHLPRLVLLSQTSTSPPLPPSLSYPTTRITPTTLSYPHHLRLN
ncbi:hypothetical protein C7M84_005757 [Penaeus vannamei]|uniref:Uncharacterized protein n=1 Tax=Penaeus vannamei TaxID=6689 RepID=A0A3R7PLF7_PENVA|nr:hypothetical protein C7M84_005757 [Penaeus vannamei]